VAEGPATPNNSPCVAPLRIISCHAPTHLLTCALDHFTFRLSPSVCIAGTNAPSAIALSLVVVVRGDIPATATHTLRDELLTVIKKHRFDQQRRRRLVDSTGAFRWSGRPSPPTRHSATRCTLHRVPPSRPQAPSSRPSSAGALSVAVHASCPLHEIRCVCVWGGGGGGGSC
jgi:hypothetical protein